VYDEGRPQVAVVGNVRLELLRREKALTIYRFWYDPLTHEERRTWPTVLVAEEVGRHRRCLEILEEFVRLARPQ